MQMFKFFSVLVNHNVTLGIKAKLEFVNKIIFLDDSDAVCFIFASTSGDNNAELLSCGVGTGVRDASYW